MDSHRNFIVRLTAQLEIAVRAVFKRFSSEHFSDEMYAFALVAPPQGDYVFCAIATEQTLDHVAQQYAAAGYMAISEDTYTLLRQELRWSNPDDGWYRYSFPEDGAFLNELAQAFASRHIELFDGTMEAVCIAVLKQLDLQGVFGVNKAREAIVISFTYGEDPSDFVRFAEELNPPSVIKRLKIEIAKGNAASPKITRNCSSGDCLSSN